MESCVLEAEGLLISRILVGGDHLPKSSETDTIGVNFFVVPPTGYFGTVLGHIVVIN